MGSRLMAWMTFIGLLSLAPASAHGANAAAAPPVQIGSPATAGWTSSTEKAATTPEQKKVLAGGKVATVTGELVEVSCYLQLGKRGEGHIPCGSDCIKHGQPAGILDDKGTLTLLFVEEHDPRRHGEGEAEVRSKLASLLARQVAATGMLTTTPEGQAALYVHASDLTTVK
jgi:hypothetical protein